MKLAAYRYMDKCAGGYFLEKEHFYLTKILDFVFFLFFWFHNTRMYKIDT